MDPLSFIQLVSLDYFHSKWTILSDISLLPFRCTCLVVDIIVVAVSFLTSCCLLPLASSEQVQKTGRETDFLSPKQNITLLTSGTRNIIPLILTIYSYCRNLLRTIAIHHFLYTIAIHHLPYTIAIYGQILPFSIPFCYLLWTSFMHHCYYYIPTPFAVHYSCLPYKTQFC